MTPDVDLVNCLDTVFDCNATLPTCRNNPPGFNFSSLYTVTERYFEQCLNGSWLFWQPNQTGIPDRYHMGLTNEACKAIAGASWTKYPGSDIWSRLTTWKFPLFQLVANCPRPPLGFWVEAFTFTHFLGDPIGTMTDVLRKIDGCQSRAMFWQDHLEEELSLLQVEQSKAERRRLWKSLAMIVDSFDEWGTTVGDKAQGYLLAELSRLCSLDARGHDSKARIRQRYLQTCLKTADALAADRSTKFVPVVIAQAFFIGSVIIAMIKTISSSEGPNATSYANVEMYSIAFTAQYFWVIFTVLWKSVIGTSQTAAALPRILSRLQRDLEKEVGIFGLQVNLPIKALDDEDSRIYGGGIYSWQPARAWTPAARNSALEHQFRRSSTHSISWFQTLILNTILLAWPVINALLPILVLSAAAATGQLISALVPPIGWSCRSVGMMWMFIAWGASYIVSFIPLNCTPRFLFWITLVKDLVIVGITFGIVIATQFGIYNRCDCYTQFGKVALQLPDIPVVHHILRTRLQSTYPAVVAGGIAIQLVLVPGLLIWRYHAAVQVFLQRDDGVSNWTFWNQFTRRKNVQRYVAVEGVVGSEHERRDDTDVHKNEKEVVVEEMEVA